MFRNPFKSNPSHHNLRPHEAQEWIQKGAHIIDVREPWEYQQGHVPGAVNLPLGQLPERLHHLPKDRPLLVVCASGARSARAAAFLVAQGFTQVANLLGGTHGWMQAGLPIKR